MIKRCELFVGTGSAALATAFTSTIVNATGSGHGRPIRLGNWHVRSYLNCGCVPR